jgi:hypothetical protein
LGNGGIAPRIRPRPYMEVSGQLHAPAALPPGKDTLVYPLDRRLGGPQSRSGRGGREKNSQPPSGIEPQNPDRPVRRATPPLPGRHKYPD